MTNAELIAKASSVLRPRMTGGRLTGDVGSAVLSEGGNLYLGVCVDTPGALGFCAEQNAIGAMLTAGESKIQKIVAVWRNEQGVLFAGAPCGRCREFMRQVHESNLDAEVIMNTNRTLKLRELLPNHEWWTEAVEKI